MLILHECFLLCLHELIWHICCGDVAVFAVPSVSGVLPQVMVSDLCVDQCMTLIAAIQDVAASEVNRLAGVDVTVACWRVLMQ